MDPSELQELREFMHVFRNFRQHDQAPAPTPAPTPTPAPSVAVTAAATVPPILQPHPSTQTPEQQQPRRHIPETPIIHRYQSGRSAPPALSAPASYEPFLGMSTLAPSSSTLNTGHVNEARLRSAQAVLPRASGLVRRRPRGPAQHPPSLSNRPKIDQCMVEGAAVPTLRATVLVYPPLDPDGAHQIYYVYQLLFPDFLDTLEANDLSYRYELRLDMPVNELLRSVVDAMTESPSAFVFPTARRASTSAAITTLQPLALISKGRVHNNQVRVKVQPIPPTMTIGDMAVDRNRFAGEACIVEGRFIIRLAAMGFPLLSLEDDGRRHSCISHRIYSLFPRDASTMGETAEDTSGGESADERDEVSRQLMAIPTPRPIAVARTRQTRLALRSVRLATATPPLSATPPLPTRPITPDGSSTPPPVPALPSAIWDENSSFNPRPGAPGFMYSPHRFMESIFDAATRGSGPHIPLRVRGWDMDAAADHLSSLLDRAARLGDYSSVLVPDRGFGLSPNGAAVGDGLEREVIFTVLRRFTNEGTVWFKPGEGEIVTLQTLYPLSSSVPPARLLGMQRLGSICGLIMINGQSFWPLSPAIFQYLIHDCNLHSLRPAFVGEWFPALRAQLLEFLSIGPEGDLSPFQPQLVTYLDVEASAFRTRDLEAHLLLGVSLLFKATLGNQTFDHPELQAFRAGFRLPCRNGFTLPSAIRNFEGGSETFLSLISTSHISSADSVLPHIEFLTPLNHNMFLAALRNNSGDITLTFAMLIEKFLRGSGIPCRSQFEATRGAYHPIIDLSRLEIPGFRSQVLVWAATGSPFIDPIGGRIFVGPIATHDAGYGSSTTRELSASHGTFLFRTCLRTARFPVDYVLQLAQAHQPADFQEAFDFWILQQCLLGIGRHNIL
ncbi:hypothetical protein FB451DRAFT_1142912 [Mycena latifolia]|nr:hypothetical protein FB451DRAFT_1142912 [Mycena latifolia]